MEPVTESDAKERLAKAKADQAEAAATVARIVAKDALRVAAMEDSYDQNSNAFWLMGTVDRRTCHDLVLEFRAFARRHPGEDIYLTISSPGGDVMSGASLYDHMRELSAQGHKIITRATGLLASMATVIHAAGDERLIDPNTAVLLHEASGSASGSIGSLEDTAKMVKMMDNRLTNILANASGLTVTKLRNMINRKDYWLSGEEYADLGFGKLTY